MKGAHHSLHPDHYGLGFYLPLNDLGSGAVNTTPARGVGSATFTRATTATTYDSTGKIISVASGTARSYYDPTSLKYGGGLFENSRTNLALQSADFSNATWVKLALTIGGSVTLPDGTTGTVNKLQEDNTNNAHLAKQAFTKAASILVYAISIYVKQAERNWLYIDVNDSVNSARPFFNIGTGTLGTVVTVGSGQTATSAIQALPNGWYRCSAIVTTTTSTTLNVQIGVSTGDTTVGYTGTTGSGLYAWGAQLELVTSTNTVSSYIPTTTVAVARNADILSYQLGSNISNTLGSWTCVYTPVFNTKPPSSRILASTGASNNGMFIAATPSLNMYDGTNTVGTASTGLTVGTPTTVGGSWGGSVMKAYQNGFAMGSGSFDGDLGLATSLQIGGSFSANCDAALMNVRIFQRIISDIEFAVLGQI